jgi:ABC-type multidrug transport system fused ATPase/permease subunit
VANVSRCFDQIEPGQTVALVRAQRVGQEHDPEPAAAVLRPRRGVVTLDGRDVRSITRDSLRGTSRWCSRRRFLFNDSILDNIRYGHAEATMEQVIAAATAANAHEFIAQLPNGYDTKVGERGVRLSGGQKQRISIARAFLANPTVLLLDEPTSSVEPDSEAAIIAALDRLMRPNDRAHEPPAEPDQPGRCGVRHRRRRVTASGSPDELRARAGGGSSGSCDRPRVCRSKPI